LFHGKTEEGNKALAAATADAQENRDVISDYFDTQEHLLFAQSTQYTACASNRRAQSKLNLTCRINRSVITETATAKSTVLAIDNDRIQSIECFPLETQIAHFIPEREPFVQTEIEDAYAGPTQAVACSTSKPVA